MPTCVCTMRCSSVTRPATILLSRSPAQPGSPSKRVGADAGASTSPLGSLTNKSSTKLTKMMPASSITAAVQLPVASRSVPLMAGERTAPIPEPARSTASGTLDTVLSSLRCSLPLEPPFLSSNRATTLVNHPSSDARSSIPLERALRPVMPDAPFTARRRMLPSNTLLPHLG